MWDYYGPRYGRWRRRGPRFGWRLRHMWRLGFLWLVWRLIGGRRRWRHHYGHYGPYSGWDRWL